MMPRMRPKWLELASLAHTIFTLSTFSSLVRVLILKDNLGAQWLSGRVLDSRPRGRGSEPHRRHCVVVLEQDTFILASGRPALFN